MAANVQEADFLLDGDAIFQLVNECYLVEIGNSGLAFKSTPRMMDPAQADFRKSYEEGRVLKIVATNGKGVDGVLFFELMPERESVFFGPFAVRKQHAGKGYGRALISHMENVARKAGMKWVLLYNVNHRQDLSALYAHWGFEALEETVPYPVESRLTRPSHFIQLRRAL